MAFNGPFSFMDTITRNIADYTAGVSFADITDEAIHAAVGLGDDSSGAAAG